MSNYIYYNGELYHHGVKGMKWGVRRSPEVQAVNKRYKEELKPHQKELRSKNRTVSLKKLAYDSVIGRNTITSIGAYADKRDNRREYNQKKKELQEKYEPEFQKAKQQAESRLAKEKAQNNTSESTAKIKSIGKKAAIGAVAAIGTVAVATLIADASFKKDYGVSAIDMYATIKKLERLKK